MATTMDPNLLGVRDTLKNQFQVDGKRLGWNSNNGMVQIDGVDVFKPKTNIDGTTYDTQDTFNSYSGKINDLNQKYNLQQQAMNPQGLNPYQNQVGDLVNQLKGLQSQPMPTIQDVYNSPQYAAQKAQQQLQAQQGISAAQEALGASGMARSSDLAHNAQNIQNQANQYLETQTVPQILAQLQSQRDNQYNKVANFLSTLAGLNSQANNDVYNQQNGAARVLEIVNNQNQRQFENQFNTDKFNYGKQQDAIVNNQNQQKIDESAKEFAAQMGYNYDKLTQDQQQFIKDLAIRQQQASTASGELGLRQQEFNWSKDPNNPENIYKLSYANYRDAKAGNVDQNELNGLYTGLSSGKIDPASALDEIQTKKQAGIYNDADAAALTKVIQQFAQNRPQSPMPQLTPNQVSQIDKSGGKNYQVMNEKQLQKEWENDPTGQAAGTPMIDWAMWAKDPRGKIAGVSFPSYQQAYGPRLSAN